MWYAMWYTWPMIHLVRDSPWYADHVIHSPIESNYCISFQYLSTRWLLNCMYRRRCISQDVCKSALFGINYLSFTPNICLRPLDISVFFGVQGTSLESPLCLQNLESRLLEQRSFLSKISGWNQAKAFRSSSLIFNVFNTLSVVWVSRY